MVRSRLAKQFPLFKSETQARVLAAIFAQDDPAMHVSAVAERAGRPVSSVQREIDRLEDAGLLISMRVGRNRVVGPNPLSPYVEDVRRIVLKTYGPPAVLAEEIADIEGVEEAYVFGSWAARSAGVSGPSARDIDFVVIGDPAVSEIYDAAQRAETRLGLDVNPVVVSREEWERPRKGFLSNVKAGALVRFR